MVPSPLSSNIATNTAAAGAKVAPLNEAAVAVLKGLPRVEGDACVFPGANLERPLVNLRKPWRKSRARAGVADVRIHDLRHSFASFRYRARVWRIVVDMDGGLLEDPVQAVEAKAADSRFSLFDLAKEAS